MKYESLIFDVDGTLWNAQELLAESYNIQLESEGKTPYVTVELLQPLFGKTMTALADGLFPQIPVPERYQLLDRCIATMDRHLAENASPAIGYPALRETMEKLAREHRLFIVSNGPAGYAQLAGKALGLSDLMSGYLSWGDTGKPKGQTIAQLMQEHEIQSAVYIGDTQGDMEACREAGIDFIWAAYGFGKAESFVMKIDTFADLAKERL